MRKNCIPLKIKKSRKTLLIFGVIFLLGINPGALSNNLKIMTQEKLFSKNAADTMILSPLRENETNLKKEPVGTQQGWKLVKKNNCTVLQAPVDTRLGSLSGSYMMILGIQYLHPNNWESECSQGGLNRFLGELTEEDPWQEITRKFTGILLDAGYTTLGMDSQCQNRMPFVYCFDVEVKTGWPWEYSWEEIMTDEWAENTAKEVKRVAENFQDNPLCIGCFLENEIFWHWRDLNISEEEWITVHNRFVDVMVAAIKTYAPHWLIFSNKYCTGLADSELTWDWMTPQIMKDAFVHDIEAGVDVICLNDYLPTIEEAKQIGLKLKKYEENLSALTNKPVTVMLAETGFQANAYERMKSIEEGHQDIYQRYTAASYPQVNNQTERAHMMGIVINSVTENGGLGVFMHAACDHGPQYAPWWQFWKRCNYYSNWGIYDPWRDKLYDDFIDNIKKIHKSAIEKRENDMNITLWYGGPSESDLDCNGELTWTNVKPGDVLTGSFTIKNIGKENSQLNWEITSYPNWGTWTFTPEHGENLTPGDTITVEVSVVIQKGEKKKYADYIYIMNTEDSNDFSVVPVSLTMQKNSFSSNSKTEQPSLFFKNLLFSWIT